MFFARNILILRIKTDVKNWYNFENFTAAPISLYRVERNNSQFSVFFPNNDKSLADSCTYVIRIYYHSSNNESLFIVSGIMIQ